MASSAEPGVGDVTSGDSGNEISVHPYTVCNTNPSAAAIEDMYLALMNYDTVPV